MDGLTPPPDPCRLLRADVERLRAELHLERRRSADWRRIADELREGLDRVADRDLGDSTLTFRQHAEAMKADAARAITRAEGG